MPLPSNPVASPSKAKLLVPASPDWYNFLPPISTTSNPVSASQLATLLNRASSLHASELSIFSARPNAAAGSSASDQAFLRNILASGTLSDRLSVLTLMAQGAPLHNIRALEALRNLAEKGRGGVGASQDTEKSKGKAPGREDRLKAARAIMDWWIGGGTPNRKLKYFRDQPLLHPDITDQHLVIWYFEDWLKKYFFSYLRILEAFSLDPLPYVRTQSLNLIATLLRSNPEQEQNLLRLLVNKLGDTESAICARTSHHLLHILQEHPAMKAVVIRETTALIMRPNPPSALPMASHPETSNLAAKHEKSVWHAHARHYATITFNQIVLSTSEADRGAARTLMDVYFRLFREVVGERQPGTADDTAPEQLTDKGKQKKKPKFIKGKGKEVRGAAGFAEVQDSNARLVGAILTGVNRALPYAQFRGADAEFDMHIGTLFLLVHTSTFNISLRALTLLQQIASSLPATSPIVSRFYRALYATLLDPRLYTTRNQALFLNLLFKSLKADAEKVRVIAFVKRFCQLLASGSGGSEFVAGGLWLLGELFTSSPGLCTLIDKAPAVKGGEYDPHKREPQYSHAQSSPLWELTTLLHHAHPTVALLARQLLSHEPLTTSSDLTLYTLTHFLDRFVYKNPKKAGARGASAMQPSTTGGADGVRRVRADIQETPLNIDGWWRRGEGAVPADQAFFQRFFSQKHAKENARAAKVDKRKAKHDDSGTETDGECDNASSDEDSDAEVWKAMKASMPRASPSCNDDSDDDDDRIEDSVSGSEANEDAYSDPEGDEEDHSDAERDSNVCDYEETGLSAPVDPTPSDEVGCNAEERTSFSDSKKRKRDEYRKEDVQTRKKRLRSLPAFASYEDYAQMIEDEPEENL